MDICDRTWQGIEPLIFISWNPTELYCTYTEVLKAGQFIRSHKNWNPVSLIPTLFPFQIWHNKHEILLPLVIVIPASCPYFQLKSRVSQWKKKTNLPSRQTYSGPSNMEFDNMALQAVNYVIMCCSNQ